MFNNPRITKQSATVDNQMVINSMPHKAVGCRVPASAANGTDGLGRPIMKMGTPLTGDLTDRQTPMTVTPADAMPTGLLIHDVPLDGGDGNGSLLIDGGIILEYVDEDIQTLIKATSVVDDGSNIKVLTRK